MGLFGTKKATELPHSPEKLQNLTDYGGARGLRVHKVAGEVGADGHKTLLGVRLLEPPTHAIFPGSFLRRAADEGWVSLTEPGILYLHTGPEHAPMRQVEAVETYRFVTFHTLEGDVTYEITQQPGRGDRSYHGRVI